MTLHPSEYELFKRLWFCIDSHVAENANLFSFPRDEGYVFTTQQLVQLRAYLGEHPELLEQFIETNPCGLSSDELDIVRGFRNGVRGNFFVERCLKHYVIFIGMDPSNAGVYAVAGLSERIQDVLGKRCQLMVQTTLLPFHGRIVWDGIAGFYNLYFGPGIRREYKDEYMRAKDHGEIITSLPPGSGGSATSKTRPRKPGRDWRPAMDEIVAAVEKLGRPRARMQRAAFRLLKYAAALARETLEERPDVEGLLHSLRGLTRAYDEIAAAIERERWS